MKIYVVTQGWYDDYHIITATEDEQLAKAVAEKFEDTEIKVYDKAEQLLKPCWFVRFDANGEVVQMQNNSLNPVAYERLNECDFDAFGQVFVHVVADDPTAATEAAARCREEFLTEQKAKE